jgi:hypothetical protein
MTEIIRIPNIEKYTQNIINGELILTPIEKYITQDELSRTILKHSKILECVVKKGEEIISNKTKYRQILHDIWKSMPAQKILQTTEFNIKLTNEDNNPGGYLWCPELHFSVQDKDTKYTMREILNMIKVNNYSIKMSIKLETEQIIQFKINE